MAKLSVRFTPSLLDDGRMNLDANSLCQDALWQNEDQILDFLMETRGVDRYYEGGIFGWFGWGSVLIDQLGIKINLLFDSSECIELTLEA